MICSEVARQRLEYPRLQQLLAGQTQSEPGRQWALELAPLPSAEALEQALNELDEATEALQEEGAPSLGECWDLAACLAAARAVGSLIAATDLRKIGQSLRSAVDCRRWFQQVRPSGELARLADQLSPLSDLQRRLEQTVGSRDEILDSASPALAELRTQVRRCRERIKQLLDRLLTSDSQGACFQERLVTQRNGRYVVPLKSDCRGRIQGFVQDESASGQTLYLEPAEVLADNNRLHQLLREEHREERRILLELADLVRQVRPQLEQNQQLLARLDLRFAAARLSRLYHGCRPQLVDEPLIELRQARHPLLMIAEERLVPEAAVPIDLLLAAECQALVISGPNTGGKSVALKTLGLLQLMLASGLHLPCAPESRVQLPRQLFVSIGDEQSIVDQLSTFSGQLLRLRTILEQAESGSLVLLDEAGSGTDPSEGAALVQALLEQLCRQGAKTLVTTHLGQLKHFAHQQPGIENAAVEFDPDTLEPTYRLLYGMPGTSGALATARRLGLPESLVARAEVHLGQGEHDSSRLIADLQRKQQELDERQQQVEKLRQQAAASQQLRRRQLQQLQERKQEILQRATGQADELISATEEQLKQLRRQARERPTPQQSAADKRQLHAARERLRPYKPQRRRARTDPDQLQEGELVRLIALGTDAEVRTIEGRQVELLVNGKRMRQPVTAIEPYQPRRFAAQRSGTGQFTRQLAERPVSQQIKLIGERVDDALARLEPFLSDALVHHLSQVEIIHGAGEGILRRAVREFLAAQQGVTAFYAAPADRGGENITIAELNGR